LPAWTAQSPGGDPVNPLNPVNRQFAGTTEPDTARCASPKASTNLPPLVAIGTIRSVVKLNLQLVAFLALAALAAVLAQGPLTPPADAPAPTMKTLDQLEPRTKINAVNTPGNADSQFKITRAGSRWMHDSELLGRHP
jgi:hypothetical protein